MTTTKRTAVLVVALAIQMVMVATAAAGPPSSLCDNKPDLPSCSTTTEPEKDGLSCQDASIAYPNGTSTIDSWNIEGSNSKTFTLTPEDSGRCIDLWTDEPMIFRIDVTEVEGRLQRLYGNVRDSHPGDFCWVSWMNLDDLPMDTTAIPAATLNACGTEYAENKFVDGEEVRKEGIDGVTPDPLVFTVLSEWRGKKIGSVEVTITATSAP